jgi:hypothetical protein
MFTSRKTLSLMALLALAVLNSIFSLSHNFSKTDFENIFTFLSCFFVSGVILYEGKVGISEAEATPCSRV